MVVEEDFLKLILKCIAEKFKLQKWHYVKENARNIVNYIGEIEFITLADTNGLEKKLIIKSIPYNIRTDSLANMIYGREAHVYTALMTMFKNLQTDVNLQQLYPECYYVDHEQKQRVLVLKDMTVDGFRRYDKELLDYQHTVQAIKSIARFHALSFIALERKVDIPQREMLRPFVRDDPLAYILTISKMIKKYLYVFDNTEYFFYLDKLCKNVGENMEASGAMAHRKIYGHGDLWKENILFKYTDKKPTEACLLDFQNARVMSPANDLLFLILSGTDTNTRKKYFNHFLHIYFETLQKTIADNVSDIQNIYTYDDFCIDLRKTIPIAVTLMVFSYILWFGFENFESSILVDEYIDNYKREEKEMKLRAYTSDLLEDLKNLGHVTFER